MADAVSPKEIERIAETIGPIIHKLAADAYKVGFEAGERKERERCARHVDEITGPTRGWLDSPAHMKAWIRGGESTT